MGFEKGAAITSSRFLLNNLILAFAYAVTAKLGLLAATPPGYASAIFPASGIALGFLLIWGRPYAFGVFLGSLALNIWHHFPTLESMPMSGIAKATLIGAGAALQAWVGAKVLHRRHILPGPLNSNNLVRFYLLSGPLSCLVSATIGISSLTLLGFIDLGVSWYQWLFWWSGDLLGVWIVTPLMLILFGHPSAYWRTKLTPIGIPLILGTCLALTFFVFAAKLEIGKLQALFTKRTAAMDYKLRHDLDDSLDSMKTIETLFKAFGTISWDEQERAIKNILNLHQELSALGLNIMVKPQNIPKINGFLAQQYGDKYRVYQLNAAGQPSEEIPEEDPIVVTRIVPLKLHERAIGFNVGSEKWRRESFMKSLREKRAITTAPISLVQTGTTGMLVILPLEEDVKGLEHLGPKFVVGVHDFHVIASKITDPETAKEFRFEIQDVTSPDAKAFYHQSPRHQPLAYSPLIPPLHHTRDFEFAGRIFRLNIEAAKSFYTKHFSMLSWFVLMASLVLVSLLSGFLFSMISRREEIEALVKDGRKKNDALIRANKDLEQARQEAETLSQAKSEFLANVSHEIRTPLTSILGFANLPKSQRNHKSYQGIIEKNLTFLMDLIDRLLETSKIESGTITLKPTEFNLIQEIEHTLDILQPKALEKKLRLDFDIKGTLNPTVYSDKTRLKQIIINLLENALKFTSQGGIHIVLSKPQQDCFQLTIKDSGTGIAEEDAHRIFHPWTQAENASGRSSRGVGLGLFLSKELSRLLGGDLKLLKSEPGIGSTFALTFQKNIPGFAVKTIQGASAKSDQFESVKGCDILIVEDSEDIRILNLAYFESLGANVTIASDGIEAVEKAKDQTFDFVLMDIQMPKLDGYGATRQLRQGGYNSPIFALTARLMDDERQKAFDAGCDECFEKPIDFVKLVGAIHRHRPKAKGP